MASHNWTVKGKYPVAGGRATSVRTAWVAAYNVAVRKYQYPNRDVGPLTLTVNGVAVTVQEWSLHATVKKLIASAK